MLSSPDLSVIENHIAVSQGSAPSLADAPEYPERIVLSNCLNI